MLWILVTILTLAWYIWFLVTKQPSWNLVAKRPRTKINAKEIPWDEIRLEGEFLLGEGNFSQVFRGWYNGEKVAVKVLRGNNSEKDFYDEVELVSELNHPNIVKLLGVCSTKKPMMMVFEYMNNGDLLQYLRNNRGKLSKLNQLDIMCQVLSAVNYLHGHDIIHRDIAARNVLVSLNAKVSVKVADLGMSRKIQNTVYKLANHDRVFHQWMAPESVRSDTFTKMSDTWSLGVLIWEVLTFGETPWPKMSHFDAIKGMYPKLPCPDPDVQDIYALLQRCLVFEPEGRISVDDLYKCLLNIYRQEYAKVSSEKSSSSNILLPFPTVSRLFPL